LNDFLIDISANFVVNTLVHIVPIFIEKYLQNLDIATKQSSIEEKVAFKVGINFE